MKSLKSYIQEKLVIKKNKATNYKYFPQTKKELKAIIEKRIEDEGNKVDLNDIDVSNITDMSALFEGTNFNGDISKWNVSNVINMRYTFSRCKSFNQDISRWDVSNVEDLNYMFWGCESFNQDISTWDVSKVKNNKFIFNMCPIEEKYKPKFAKTVEDKITIKKRKHSECI